MQQRKLYRKKKQWILLISLSLFFPAFHVKAQTFEYPELNIVPRTSKRIEMEAAKEPTNRWGLHWAVQASALMTLTAAALHDANIASHETQNRSIGYGVGSFWLVSTVAFSALYHPFRSSEESIKNLPNKSKREQIYRERMAELDLKRAARFGKFVYWSSALTNAAASTLLTIESQSKSSSLVLGAMATVFAFLPPLMGDYWSNVADEQDDFRKRVYGPVAKFSVTQAILQEPITKKLAPGFQLSLKF